MLVVLTLGRSGSSLLMQTLGLLGCTVIGRKFDHHSDPERARKHHSFNPGGYLEEPDIYLGGPRSSAFQSVLKERPEHSACKMDLRHLFDPNQQDAWLDAAPHITALLISFRHPSEQAQSEYRTTDLADSSADAQARFVFITNFLNEYRVNYGSVLSMKDEPLSQFGTRIHLVDLAEMQDPKAYVRRVAMLGRLNPSGEETGKAISNIDPRLLRVRAQEIDPAERVWATDLGAADVFSDLRSSRDQDR